MSDNTNVQSDVLLFLSFSTGVFIISTGCWITIFPWGPWRVAVMAAQAKPVQLFFTLCLTLEAGKEKTFLSSFAVHFYIAVNKILAQNLR